MNSYQQPSNLEHDVRTLRRYYVTTRMWPLLAALIFGFVMCLFVGICAGGAAICRFLESGGAHW
jgi:hypothetical protein